MFARQIISDNVKPIEYNATGENALLRLHDYNISQLPVVENGIYIGLISLDEISLAKHLDEPLNLIHKFLKKPYVRASSHLFEVMKLAVEYNVKVVPVLADDSDTYLGLVTAESCLREFALLNSVQDDGAVIELSIPIRDYSLSKIAHIVEDNGATILTVFTNIDQASSSVMLTLKLNTIDVQKIANAFERYGYAINGWYNDDEYTTDLKDRYDAFIKYINI